jgi:hypothetical protein
MEMTSVASVLGMFSDELALFGAGIQPQSYFVSGPPDGIHTVPEKYPTEYTLSLSTWPWFGKNAIKYIYLPPNTKIDISEYDSVANVYRYYSHQSGKSAKVLELSIGNGDQIVRANITNFKFTYGDLSSFIVDAVCLPPNPAPPFTSDDRKFEVCDRIVSSYCYNNYTDPRCGCYTEQIDIDRMFTSTANVWIVDTVFVSQLGARTPIQVLKLVADGVEYYGGVLKHFNQDGGIRSNSTWESNGVALTSDQYIDIVIDHAVFELNNPRKLVNVTRVNSPPIGMEWDILWWVYTLQLSSLPKTFVASRDGKRIKITKIGDVNFNTLTMVNDEVLDPLLTNEISIEVLSFTVNEISRAVTKNTNDLTVRMNMSAACVGATCPKSTSYKTLDQRREQCHVQCIQILDISGTDLIARGKQTLECGNQIYDVEKKEVIGPAAGAGSAAAAASDDSDGWLTLPNLMMIGIGALFLVLFVTWLILRAVKKHRR